MTSETRVFTIEETSHRVLCQVLKASVKADAVTIRQHRQTKGKARDGLWLSHLQNMKSNARARHLVYGFVRGHDRSRMETEKSRPIQTWYLQKAWNAATAEATKVFDAFAYTNDLIKKYL